MKKTDKTSPIINFLFSDKEKSEQYLKDSMSLIFTRGKLSCKDFHKKKLGKQKYCWISFVKHWVWETETWRVYVSKRGASFEVLATLSNDEAWEAWQDYFNKIK